MQNHNVCRLQTDNDKCAWCLRKIATQSALMHATVAIVNVSTPPILDSSLVAQMSAKGLEVTSNLMAEANGSNAAERTRQSRVFVAR